MLVLPLDKKSGRPLYMQIADGLDAMIRAGALASGVKLPSSRDLARDVDVSRATAVAALEELTARGLIFARGGSGHYVAGLLRQAPRVTAAYPLDGDVPTGALAPRTLLARGAEAFFDDEAFAPSPVEGQSGLRRAFAAHAAARGISASPELVLAASGGRQGLGASLAALRGLGVSTCWCPRLCWEAVPLAAQSDGLVVRRFDELQDHWGPHDVVYLNPTFANPTGRSLDEETRRAFVRASERQGFWILEDDAYGDLRWTDAPRPALRAYGGERVIFLASLSQTFCPGLRVGYMVVPPSVKGHLTAVIERRFGPLASPLQAWARHFLESDAFGRALNQIRVEGASRMDALWQGLGGRLEKPEGGVYFWLPTSCPGVEAASLLAEKEIAVSPGELFGPGGWGVRLSISALEPPALRRAGRIIAQTLRC